MTASPHPASEHVNLLPTIDETTIRRWWRRGPDAPVLLPAGLRFDVLDVPAEAAQAALDRVRMTGYHLGPVARTVGGRLQMWVRPGVRMPAMFDQVSPWPYPSVGLHCRGRGEYVLAPPSVGTTWVHPPSAFTQPTLPQSADILPAVVAACR